MEVRKATNDDIPKLLELFRAVIVNMHQQGYKFWDEAYPIQNILQDVKNEKLYVLIKDDIFMASFSLNEDNPGQNHVTWTDNDASFVYFDRLAVNVSCARQGVGTLAIDEARKIAKKMNKSYLRLFVASTNIPALKLYRHNNFIEIETAFYDVVNGIKVKELGFEIKLF